MEYLDIIYPVLISILVVFLFLQQWWSLMGHGDAQKLKEKKVMGGLC
jgi:hypothetical protein